MAYGDQRITRLVDDFDTRITPSWRVGSAFEWAAGGYIQPAAANTEAYMEHEVVLGADQFCKATIQTLDATDYNDMRVFARFSSDFAASYSFKIASTSAGSGVKYELLTTGDVSIASGGTPGGLTSGDTVTIECVGTTIRGGTSESGGADTERLTTTDNTVTATGFGGIDALALSVKTRSQITRVEIGEIGVFPAVAAQSLIVRRPRSRYAI